MTTTLSIRVPTAFGAALDRAASAATLSRSGWIRQELVRALPTASEPITLPPSPPIRSHVAPEDLATVSKLSADLSRMGGAVVQLTKALRETGHPWHHDAEAALADIRQTQRQLSGLITTMSTAVVAVL